MSRIIWSCLAVVLLALPLTSCFNDASTCQTCPPENSGRIEVVVPQGGLVDSIQVAVDAGSRVTIKRGRRWAFEGLSRGPHDVTIVRWFTNEGLISSKLSELRIQLERGETRVIVFHNDFPLVSWSPRPAADRAGPRAVDGPAGWMG